MPHPRDHACPICGEPVDPATSRDADAPYPFCSRRCRMVDLNRWFEGAYQVPAERDEDAEGGPGGGSNGGPGDEGPPTPGGSRFDRAGRPI